MNEHCVSMAVVHLSTWRLVMDMNEYCILVAIVHLNTWKLVLVINLSLLDHLSY